MCNKYKRRAQHGCILGPTCPQMDLEVCSNEIGDDGLKAMAAVLAIRTDFKRPILNRNCLEEPVRDWDEHDDWESHVRVGVKNFATVLKTHLGLADLELRRTSLEWGGRSICEAINVNTSLTSLGLSQNMIYQQGGQSIANSIGIKDCKMLQLNLSGCYLGYGGMLLRIGWHWLGLGS